MAQTTSPAAGKADRAAAKFAQAALLAAVGAVIACAVIALIARGLGAPDEFQPLTPPAYIPLTVIGVLAGAAGWQIVRRRAGDPSAVLRWLVPVAVAVSLVPDVAVGVNHSQPGTTWGGVTALMIMHVAVAAVAVPVFRRLLPLR